MLRQFAHRHGFPCEFRERWICRRNETALVDGPGRHCRLQHSARGGLSRPGCAWRGKVKPGARAIANTDWPGSCRRLPASSPAAERSRRSATTSTCTDRLRAAAHRRRRRRAVGASAYSASSTGLKRINYRRGRRCWTRSVVPPARSGPRAPSRATRQRGPARATVLPPFRLGSIRRRRATPRRSL